MVGFIITGLMVVSGLWMDRNLEVALRPSDLSLGLYLTAVTAAIPLLYMSWINKFKRIRDIRGTRKKEALWFGLWILAGFIPYSGIIMAVTLGLIKGKITNKD